MSMSGPSGPRPDRALFYPFLVLFTLEDMFDENAWRDHMVWIDVACVDQMFNFDDRDAASRSHHRIEITRRAVVGEIPGAIAFERADKGKVGANGRFEDVVFTVDQPRFFSFGDDRAVGGRREEPADAGAAGSDAF